MRNRTEDQATTTGNDDEARERSVIGTDTGRERRMRRVGMLCLAAGTALTAMTAGCSGGSDGGAEAADTAEDSFTRVINVEVREVRPRTFRAMISLTGTVEANRDVTFSAEESGVIREIFVEKGSPVQVGQPLAKIDDRVLASQVRQAEAQASLAEETWERRKRLWEEDRVGSELAYLEARSAAEQARANVQSLRERLDRTVIRAPIDGILDRRLVEVGTMVSPGTPVGRIIDMNPAKVAAGVPERYAGDVVRGSETRVTLDVLGGPVYEGTVGYVGASVDPSSRTFPVEILIPNPGRAIKPEMVAEVQVVRRVMEEALVVPQEAVVRMENGYAVFIVEEEGEETVAVARPVTVGASQGNEVVVEQGLETGDRIVVAGQQQLASGDRVRIVEEG